MNEINEKRKGEKDPACLYKSQSPGAAVLDSPSRGVFLVRHEVVRQGEIGGGGRKWGLMGGGGRGINGGSMGEGGRGINRGREVEW